MMSTKRKLALGCAALFLTFVPLVMDAGVPAVAKAEVKSSFWIVNSTNVAWRLVYKSQDVSGMNVGDELPPGYTVGLDTTFYFASENDQDIVFRPVSGPDFPCWTDGAGFPAGPCGNASFYLAVGPVIGAKFTASRYAISYGLPANYTTSPGARELTAVGIIEPLKTNA